MAENARQIETARSRGTLCAGIDGLGQCTPETSSSLPSEPQQACAHSGQNRMDEDRHAKIGGCRKRHGEG